MLKRLCVALTCGSFVGCGSIPVTELPQVEPPRAAEAPPPTTTTGTLVVNSRGDYALYSAGGHLMRNARTRDDDSRRDELSLPPGDYFLIAEGGSGVVRVPVRIVSDRVTVVDLDRAHHRGTR